jgi:hypothetical protein
MKITAAQAEPFFAHPSQRRGAMLEAGAVLPDWLDYYAHDGVCGAFHNALWPGVLMMHIGVMPQMWGRLDNAILDVVSMAISGRDVSRVIAWVLDENKAVLSLARRIGWTIDGRLALPEPVTMIGFNPCQLAPYSDPSSE